MGPYLLQTPAFLPPAETLRKAQLTSRFLASQPAWTGFLARLFQSESQERWVSHENLLIASLKVGDDQAAHKLLQRLIDRFGPDNERVQTLRGLYDEATAEDEEALLKMLAGYEALLVERPTNVGIRKRRVVLLKSLGRFEEAVKALTQLVDDSPVDPEAWSELADMYLSQGMHAQALFCLEEVLLLVPFAWNIHARIGETTLVMASTVEVPGERLKLQTEAMRRFCRSVELCNDYLRGYYGLRISTTKVLEALDTTSKTVVRSSDATNDTSAPLLGSVQRLNELATTKLGEILRKTSAGYDPNELRAARELLDRDTRAIQR